MRRKRHEIGALSTTNNLYYYYSLDDTIAIYFSVEDGINIDWCLNVRDADEEIIL